MFGLISKALGGSCHEAQAMALREIVQVFYGNSGQVHDLCMSEDFLARFDSYHGTSPLRFLESPKVPNLRTIAESEQIHVCLYSQCKQPVPDKHPCQWPCQAKAGHHRQKHLST